MFEISDSPLDVARYADDLCNARAGALVTFEGWVRDHHDGRTVTRLEYEAFDEMAASTGNAILDEARERFAILEARVVHRVGVVGIEERAIWVGVTAEHRQEAFLACRWIMDRIKRDVPIWKRETYAGDPDPAWVNAGEGSASGGTDPALDPRYARQVVLSEVGMEGQRRLAEARVLVIGAGGLGCPALQYLAAAGVGTLTIVDGDRVDESNLHRQVLFGDAEIGRNKAEAAADRLRAMNPHIALRSVADAATPANLPALLEGQDVVLDCTDAFEPKYAIHDTCWEAGIILVQAAVYQLDGHVQVIDPRAGAGCFRCLWPEPPPAGCVGNCAEAGVLGVTPGLLGTYQATETLKVLLSWPDSLRDSTLLVDVQSGEARRIRRTPRDDCACRGGSPWPGNRDNLLFPGQGAAEILRHAAVIDLREPAERRGDPDWIQKLPNVPRAEWLEIPQRFGRRPLVLCCAGGSRTRQCIARLQHPAGVFAWTRGIHELERLF